MTTAQIYEFKEHCFPICVKFVPYQEGWDALMDELGLPHEQMPQHSGVVNLFEIHEGPDVAVITFGLECETRTANEVSGIIVHELTHVKQHINDQMYKYSSGRGDRRLDMETEAYLMQQMMMWLQGAYADSGRGFDDGQDESKGQLQG